MNLYNITELYLKMVNFMLCIFYHNKKLGEKHKQKQHSSTLYSVLNSKATSTFLCVCYSILKHGVSKKRVGK